jgi:hypothetical protein
MDQASEKSDAMALRNGRNKCKGRTYRPVNRWGIHHALQKH